MSLFELVAHRGYTLHYPENTLLAIDAAVKAGARFVEVDIQLSADEVPFLFHDRSLERLCAEPGALHEYPASELAHFHAADRGRFADKFQGTPITRLSELVTFMQAHPKLTVFIELKRSSIERFGIDTMVRQTLSLLRPVQSQCVIISYNIPALAHVQSEYGWAVGAVVDDWQERTQADIKQLRPEYLFCDLESLPAEGDLKFNNSHIAVFECTDPQQAIALARRGVGFVETFAIGEMLKQTNELLG